MLYLASIGMDHNVSESCYKGKILQRNCRKMTMKWSFSYNSFVKFHVNKYGSHNMMTLLHAYPTNCYKNVCNKGTILYYKHLIKFSRCLLGLIFTRM